MEVGSPPEAPSTLVRFRTPYLRRPPFERGLCDCPLPCSFQAFSAFPAIYLRCFLLWPLGIILVDSLFSCSFRFPAGRSVLRDGPAHPSFFSSRPTLFEMFMRPRDVLAPLSWALPSPSRLFPSFLFSCIQPFPRTPVPVVPVVSLPPLTEINFRFFSGFPSAVYITSSLPFSTSLLTSTGSSPFHVPPFFLHSLCGPSASIHAGQSDGFFLIPSLLF